MMPEVEICLFIFYMQEPKPIAYLIIRNIYENILRGLLMKYISFTNFSSNVEHL